MKNYEIDEVPDVRDVLFVGEFFTLLTSVVLIEEFRVPGESDDDLAVRLAGEFLRQTYGWDVAAVAHEVGIVEG
jgi:hypothetical protein